MVDAAFDDWVARARDANVYDVALQMGARLRKEGSTEWAGPCPLCEGDDRFAVNTKKRVFICRGSAKGDVIAMVEHLKGCSFVQACEIIIGEPPPKRGSTLAEPNPQIEAERRDERRDAAASQSAAEDRELASAIADATALFNRGGELRGSAAEAYLRNRKIYPLAHQTVDLRFIPSLVYFGYPDRDGDQQVDLGTFPCMLAAIRDAQHRIIGVHRTYLDPIEPIKLRPPGDRMRNAAKKMFRKSGGGLIHLGPIGETLAVGEGIETTFAFYSLGLGPEDLTIAAAGSLGNMSGGATGTEPHPKKRGRFIFNGEPDPSKPGMIIPPQVKTLILLGDGDSDPCATRRQIITGARRFERRGGNALVAMAPDGSDWQDVLMAQSKEAELA